MSMELVLGTKDSMRYHGTINQEKRDFPYRRSEERSCTVGCQELRTGGGASQEERAGELTMAALLHASLSPVVFLSSLPPLLWRSPGSTWERKFRSTLTSIQQDPSPQVVQQSPVFLLSHFPRWSLLPPLRSFLLHPTGRNRELIILCYLFAALPLFPSPFPVPSIREEGWLVNVWDFNCAMVPDVCVVRASH